MKKVLITGTSRGIGLALAKKFLEEGWFVIGTSTSGKCPINHKNFDCFTLDLVKKASISNFVKAVQQKYSPIDALVNNAGVALDLDGKKLDLGLLRKTLEVNLFGLVDLTEQLIPNIVSGGRIVNLSSMMGSLSKFGGGDSPAYRISKTALNMYTRTLADRLKDKKITVSSVHPGWVRTDMGGSNAPKLPDIPAKEIFELVNSDIESGYFWYEGKKHPW